MWKQSIEIKKKKDICLVIYHLTTYLQYGVEINITGKNKTGKRKSQCKSVFQGLYWEHWDLNYTGIVKQVQNTSKNFPVRGQEAGVFIL